ncbi:MAG TPA: GNAT family N-acetyltransferase [Brevundimonas sp.]|jgi:RimJ/RimL family protein N-acetyltransferase|uniref:GNAT family N-acetyltransferase n=1 Tax=Brevundimonas sp. TaxID=1871086 RepID=UPI002BEA0104|nr:GNAT family N-acetyltransferase [Brevundimonas sp.]HRH20749.1 GNAT family N-acetyltransferase [Brevundimonas sp.]
MCLIETSPEISTRRLTLRAPAIEDATRIAEICADPAVSRMTVSMPHPYGLGEAEAWIARAQGQDPRRERNFVIDHEDAGVVGMVSLFPQPGRQPHDRGPDRPGLGTELGYCVGAGWQGRGFATEAVQGLLAWARRDWRRRVVAASHFTDNPASGRVLEKAGFLYTGERMSLFSRAREAATEARLMVWLA